MARVLGPAEEDLEGRPKEDQVEVVADLEVEKEDLEEGAVEDLEGVSRELLVVRLVAKGEMVVAARVEGKVVVKEAMAGQEEVLAAEVVGNRALLEEVKAEPEEVTEEEGVAMAAVEEATVALPVSLVAVVEETGEARLVGAKVDLEGMVPEVRVEMAEVDQQWKKNRRMRKRWK